VHYQVKIIEKRGPGGYDARSMIIFN